MKILAVASICPVPGVHADNDIIVRFYRELCARYPDVEVRLLRPVFYATAWMAHLKQSWVKYYQMRRVEKFQLHGIDVHVIPYLFVTERSAIYLPLSRLVFPCNRRRLTRITEDFAFDLVHSHRIHIDGRLGLDIARSYRRPLLVSTQREAHRFATPAELAATGRVLSGAQGITSLSPYAATQLRTRLGLEARIIPYGIDERFFAAERQPRRGDGALRLLSVCRLMPLKNMDIVLRSLAELRQHGDCSLTVVGDGTELSPLKQLAQDLQLDDIVCFEGRCTPEEVRDILDRHDVFVMPSAPETYGLAYAEALARGLPIVCAEDNGFAGHFVEGQEGFAVRPRDIEHLTQTLLPLLKEPQRLTQMSTKALARADDFHWDDCCAAYYAELKSLGAQGRQTGQHVVMESP